MNGVWENPAKTSRENASSKGGSYISELVTAKSR